MHGLKMQELKNQYERMRKCMGWKCRSWKIGIKWRYRE